MLKSVLIYLIKNSTNAGTNVDLPDPVLPITFIDQPNLLGTKS